MEKSKLFKQRLFRIHIASGVSFAIIMYLSIFFGVFAIFLPYVQTWEKPSRYIQKIEITKIDFNTILKEVFKEPNFPKNNILINLPGRNGESAVVISHRFAQALTFDPHTNQKIEDETKEISYLAGFLNELHYGQPLKLLGRLVFGFSAVGSMLLVISGIVLILMFKFKGKNTTPQNLFSALHVKIFQWIFLPFFLIILSGAVMNIGLVSSGVMAKILSKGEANSIDGVVGTVLFAQEKPIKPTGNEALMKPISELLIQAKSINENLIFKQIKIINWNDENARVQIIGYDPYKPFLNGGFFNQPHITLKATTGELVDEKKVFDASVPVFVAEGIFFLHFLFGIDIFSRSFVAVLMGLCGIAIGFGVMLWLEKKAKRFDSVIPFYHWFGRFSLACMIGVLPATGSLFLLQWLLPFEMSDRVLWQQGIFYNFWLATLFWSYFRINAYTAAREFLLLGGILFLATVVMHYIRLQTTPWSLLQRGMSHILGVDVALILFALALLWLAKKLPKDRETMKSLFKNKDSK
jgi:uncharacterized iron-regulated membrane protein